MRDMNNELIASDVQKVCIVRTGSIFFPYPSILSQDFSNAFMIKTIAEGHNSGRNYYLQASSMEQCMGTVKLIKSLSKRAREKAAAQTRFARVQLKARKFYSSHWFQSGSATLIIAVCSLRDSARSRGAAGRPK